MNLVIVLVGAIIGNYLFGMAIHIGKDFSVQSAIEGFLELVKRLIGVAGLWIVIEYTQNIDVAGVFFSVVATTLLTIAGGYFATSFLKNAMALVGFTNIKQLDDLDQFFKELFGRSYNQLSQADLSAEISHLLNKED